MMTARERAKDAINHSSLATYLPDGYKTVVAAVIEATVEAALRECERETTNAVNARWLAGIQPLKEGKL